MKKSILLLGLMICLINANSSNYQTSGMERKDFYQVSIHILFMGTPPDSALVTLGDSSIWTYNGYATFYVEDGTYSFSVFAEGYYPSSGGAVTVSGGPLTVEILLYPILYEVTFFVNCCGEPLGGFALTIGVQTIVTFPTGMAILSLPAGTYSYIAGGIEGTVTIPPPAYIDLDICGEVTFHVTNEQGNPLENVLIDVDGSYLLTDFNGEADTCLQVGSYTYAASKLGYVAQTGTLEVDTIPQTVEIVMPAETWAVSFNCPANCTNDFNGWKCEINGVILSSGETIYLSNGSWDTYISWLGCWGVVGQILVNNSSVNITCFNLDNPVATFHVQGQTGNLQGATVTVDTFSLITNSSGDVSFCLPGGYHSYIITHEEYDTLTGNLTWSNHCQDTLLNFLMNPVSIKEERNSIFRIYPNPTTGKFYIETPNQITEPIEITVMDLTGRKVYEDTETVTGKTEINLSDQPKGMYFVWVKNGDDLFTRKIVIQ